MLTVPTFQNSNHLRLVKMQSMTIDVAVKRWQQYCDRYTVKTQEVYSCLFERFLKSLPKDVKLIEQISPEYIRDFLVFIQTDDFSGKKIKNVTYNNYLRVIRSFFTYLRKYYGIESPVERFEDAPEEPSEARVVTEEEYEKISSLIGPEQERDHATFLANTGLRVSEFCDLSGCNFQLDYSSMTIIGKGRKKRTIPLNQTCRDLLKKYDGKINFHKGKRITEKRVRYECWKLATMADIPEFGPHALRHRFATALLNKGVMIQHVAKILGHSSTVLTERTYIHILPENLKNATECLVD